MKRGYTLIEMLIALVLVSALMSAVWGMMSLYNDLLTAGTKKTAEQQLVRSVMQILSADLSAVVLDPAAAPAPVSDEPPDNEFDFDIGEAQVSDVQTSDIEFAEPFRMNFTGTATALRLTLRSVPPREFAPPSDIDLLNQPGGGSLAAGFDSGGEFAPSVHEFQSVLWQFESLQSTGGVSSLPPGLYRLQTSSADLQALLSQRSTIERGMAGDDASIDRSTLEMLLFPQTDPLRDQPTEDDAAAQPPAYDLVPEVVGCRFEYFDGRDWLPEWSGDRITSLPMAVRVSLDVISAEELDLVRATFTGAGPDDGLDSELDRSFSTTRNVATGSESGADGNPFAEIVPRTFQRIILLDATRGVKVGDSAFEDFGGGFSP